MTDLIEALWTMVIQNSLLRWFFIGLLIGLVMVGYLAGTGTPMDGGDAVMGIVACGALVLGLRVLWWFVRG
ncbi:hypothetical protein [Azospirillum halopraeferens]|uniref:hypothetical protein n=1 Tax=Azospirillum halopraeferens TaxID=34010 RepID=UPI000415AF74|nr:hypothetical protein [Azospirillum halopraeferens]